ncbi:phospholipid phosphatase 6 [Protopterus annectens]|uniref:phospholipid phosphatase 6 n=1 Tax=Protopterus annectens TaxID=7888 RepID=UPI001CFC3272|nr:phospholipid phosphatase 6 [Protopterus annectens]
MPGQSQSPRAPRDARTASGSGRFDFGSLSRPPVGPGTTLQRQGSDPSSSPARLRSSESPSHRGRDHSGSFSGPSSGSSGQQLPEQDCIKLNPSFIGIFASSLLAVDLWMSKKLGVCAGENSSWGSVRPIMKLLEISGHGIPWIACTVYCLFKSDSSAGQEVMLNLLFALILDLILVGVLKALVRRRRPSHNKMDMFVTLSVDKYSFPSGHATRAAMGARFFLNHLVLAIPVRILIVLWAFVLGISRVMLGRHNVTDVVCGFFIGYLQYSLVEYLWLSPSTLNLFFEP